MAYIEWWNRTGPITLGERFGLNEISTARKTLSPIKSYIDGGRIDLKPGGIVEPGVTHYAKKEGVGKGGNPASWGHRKIDVDLNKIIKLRKEGFTLTQIANELNVSKSKIDSAVAEAKLPRPDKGFTPPADIDVAEVKRLRAEGKTYAEITKELNVSESTLDRLVRGRFTGGEKIPRTFVTGEIRKALDSFLAEGKTSFTTSDIIKKLPEKFVLEDYHTAITQVKKEKKYNKLKFKKATNWFIKPAEDIKKVASLIDEGKTLAEIERETGFHYKFINRVEAQNKLKMPKNVRDRYINIQRITADIQKLADDNKIKDAFRVGKVDKNLLKRAGTVLKSDDVFRTSRTLFKLAEYYDGTLADYYKVNLPKPTKNQIEGGKKIIRSSATLKGKQSGYAFDRLLYEYGGKKVDRILGLADGTFLKIQKEIAETLPRKIGVDEVFGIKSSGRYAPVQAVLINPLKSTLNVEKSAVDSFKSAYHDQLKEASNIKNKAERITEQKRILNEYRTTLKKWKNNPRYKNVEFPDFEIGKHPSKTIKNWAELGPAIQKQLIADYKTTNISPKVTKARNIFQVAEEVGSKTWKNLSPEIQNLLRVAKNAKGPPRIKAIQLLVGAGVSLGLLNEFGISSAEAAEAQTLEPDDEKVEAGTSLGEYLLGGAGIGVGTAISNYPKQAWELAKKAVTKPLALSALPTWKVAGSIKETFKAAAEKRFPNYKLTDPNTWMHAAFWDWGVKTFGLDKTATAFGESLKGLSKMDKARAFRNWVGRGLLSPKAVKFVSSKVAWPLTGIMSVHDAYKDYQERKEFLTPERIAEAQKEEFDKEEPMFAMGGIASLIK